jgi:homogentisate 1,2-dioxygenase
LRLGPNSQATVANFTNNYIQIQLGQGMADYVVFNESDAQPEIDTPNVSIHPAHQDVVVRVEVRPDGDTVVTVRKGEAQISTPKGIADLKEGQMAVVRGATEDARLAAHQSLLHGIGRSRRQRPLAERSRLRPDMGPE